MSGWENHHIFMASMKLKIEKNTRLLAKYGLCMALIATVENILFSFIATAKNLKRTEVKKLHGRTLGELIKEAEDQLEKKSPEILKRLNKLNKERIILAHGLVIEKKIFNKGRDKNKNAITDIKPFTLRELNKTIKDSRFIGDQLIKQIKKMIK